MAINLNNKVSSVHTVPVPEVREAELRHPAEERP